MMLAATTQLTKSFSPSNSSSRLNRLSSLPSAPSTAGLPEALIKDYQTLHDSFEAIKQSAGKEAVSENNVTPPWIGLLKQEAQKPLWQKTLGEYVLEQSLNQVTALQKQYETRSRLLETHSQATSSSQQYSQLNSSMANFEALLSGMNPQDSKTVFVGSGPQPNSVLAFSEHANEVRGIDIDAAAIEDTQPLASEKVKFEQADGVQFNYQPYSHVGLAIMVPQKEEVLKRVLATAQPGARMVVRSVDGLKKALYNGIDEKTIKELRVSSPDKIGFERKFNKVAVLHGNDENITHSYILEVVESPRRLNVVG